MCTALVFSDFFFFFEIPPFPFPNYFTSLSNKSLFRIVSYNKVIFKCISKFVCPVLSIKTKELEKEIKKKHQALV